MRVEKDMRKKLSSFQTVRKILMVGKRKVEEEHEALAKRNLELEREKSWSDRKIRDLEDKLNEEGEDRINELVEMRLKGYIENEKHLSSSLEIANEEVVSLRSEVEQLWKKLKVKTDALSDQKKTMDLYISQMKDQVSRVEYSRKTDVITIQGQKDRIISMENEIKELKQEVIKRKAASAGGGGEEGPRGGRGRRPGGGAQGDGGGGGGGGGGGEGEKGNGLNPW